MTERRIPEWVMAATSVVAVLTGAVSLFVSITALSRADRAIDLDHAEKRSAVYRTMLDRTEAYIRTPAIEAGSDFDVLSKCKQVQELYLGLRAVNFTYFKERLSGKFVKVVRACQAYRSNPPQPDEGKMAKLARLAGGAEGILIEEDLLIRTELYSELSEDMMTSTDTITARLTDE